MPILQNKLVIKSIEALHDEALALMPNTASSAAVSSPTILQSVNTPQDAQINAPEGKSADEQPEAANNHDIMARIDHLLKNSMKMMVSISRNHLQSAYNQTMRM